MKAKPGEQPRNQTPGQSSECLAGRGSTCAMQVSRTARSITHGPPIGRPYSSLTIVVPHLTPRGGQLEWLAAWWQSCRCRLRCSNIQRSAARHRPRPQAIVRVWTLTCAPFPSSVGSSRCRSTGRTSDDHRHDAWAGLRPGYDLPDHAHDDRPVRHLDDVVEGVRDHDHCRPSVRSRGIRSSTCRDSRSPSAAVGSSRTRTRDANALERATATACR